MCASTLNGCAFCLDPHGREATQAGETSERPFTIAAWPESPFYTARECAALLWTDAITNIQTGHAPHAAHAAYTEPLARFTEAEAVQLTHAIANINVWNRLAIAFRPHV